MFIFNLEGSVKVFVIIMLVSGSGINDYMILIVYGDVGNFGFFSLGELDKGYF